jgi:type I restriction enzyme M protein
MSAIEGFCDVQTELADLNTEAVDLAAKIQTNFEELGI